MAAGQLPEGVAETGCRWSHPTARPPPAQPDGHFAGRPSRLDRPVPEPAAAGAVQCLQLTLEWYLLTSLEVGCKQDAERILDWYGLRWRIEDWHRILKAGCKVEHLGHRKGERIEWAVTIKGVIAWRLAAMTLLGRETPELPAEVFRTQLQMRVLRHFAQRRGMAEPANLGLAVRTMAVMGGYLYRRCGPPPGHQKIWEGWTRLTIMSEAYELRDCFERPQTASQHEP